MQLPQLEKLTGDWKDYEDHLYQIFMDTVINDQLFFQGLPIKTQYRPLCKAKDFSFWHLISEGQVEEERVPDLRRCERIRWLAYLIQNSETSKKISWWKNKRGANDHIVIWHETESFAVVLAKRNDYYLIKTMYVVNKNRAKTFIKERDKFWQIR